MSRISLSSSFLRKSAAVFLLAATLGGGVASASSLNGIGSSTPAAPTAPATQTTQVPQQASTTPTTSEGLGLPEPVTPPDGSGAKAVGNLMQGIGVDADAASKANAYVSPLARGANIVFALILGLVFIAMFLITALDMAFIAVPPIRNLLHPQQQQQGGGGMGGMGGFGGGFGGGHQQQPSGGSFISRWISDEAVAAVGQMQPQGGGGGMGGMGGFGGGGFGGGFGGGGFGGGGFGGGMGGGQQEQVKPRSAILSYMKKRAFFFIVFGICTVLFSTTIFSDLGVKLGGWVLARLFGVEAAMPGQ